MFKLPPLLSVAITLQFLMTSCLRDSQSESHGLFLLTDRNQSIDDVGDLAHRFVDALTINIRCVDLAAVTRVCLVLREL